MRDLNRERHWALPVGADWDPDPEDTAPARPSRDHPNDGNNPWGLTLWMAENHGGDAFLTRESDLEGFIYDPADDLGEWEDVGHDDWAPPRGPVRTHEGVFEDLADELGYLAPGTGIVTRSDRRRIAQSLHPGLHVLPRTHALVLDHPDDLPSKPGPKVGNPRVVENGRRGGRATAVSRRKGRPKAPSPVEPVTHQYRGRVHSMAEIRAWAEANGHAVESGGRISAGAWAAWHAHIEDEGRAEATG